jgi:hypothetical protein
VAERDLKVSDYIAAAPAFARPILRHLRDVVHRACPGVAESMRAGAPLFDYRGPLCTMGVFETHVLLVFPKADRLTHDGRALAQKGQRASEQFGRLTSVDDLPRVSVLTALVHQAMRLNDARAGRPAK